MRPYRVEFEHAGEQIICIVRALRAQFVEGGRGAVCEYGLLAFDIAQPFLRFGRDVHAVEIHVHPRQPRHLHDFLYLHRQLLHQLHQSIAALEQHKAYLISYRITHIIRHGFFTNHAPHGHEEKYSKQNSKDTPNDQTEFHIYYSQLNTHRELYK